MSQIFTSIATVDKKYGTVYVYNIVNFPFRSIEWYIAIFVPYDWTENLILATPIKDTKDETIFVAFQTHIKYITKRGLKPCFNIIYIVALKAIKV